MTDGIIKAADFFLYGSAANGFVFQFNGLKWIENGEIYDCLILYYSLKNIL